MHIIMKTFWTYFLIFLTLTLLTQIFLYFSGGELYVFDYKYALLQLSVIFLTALITSYILRKRKNEYNKKAN